MGEGNSAALSGEIQKTALNNLATASTMIRDAIAAALPTANTQFMTVQVPGIVIDPDTYVYNRSNELDVPEHIRAAEARLVDGAVPLSKMTLGRSGKSVARSYAAALDLLVPVETSISGALAGGEKTYDASKQLIKNRYDNAMKSLAEEKDINGKSKLENYIAKQAVWAEAQAKHSRAQKEQRTFLKESFPNDIERQRSEYADWLKVSAYQFKSSIQAAYMDWVVHGNKFIVEFYFGVLDVGSCMERIEASKAAMRNLVVYDADGVTEWNAVRLEPAGWATYVAQKIAKWSTANSQPTKAEIAAEIRRLKGIVASCNALTKSMAEKDGFVLSMREDNSIIPDDVQNGMKDLYKATSDRQKALKLPTKNSPEGKTKPEDFKNSQEQDKIVDEKLAALQKAYADAAAANLKADKNAVIDMGNATKQRVQTSLAEKVALLNGDIATLEAKLKEGDALNSVQLLSPDGTPLSPEELKSKIGAVEGVTTPDRWTKVSLHISADKQTSESMSSEKAWQVSASVSWKGLSASAGASKSDVSSKAASAMAKCSVDISFSCLLVEIQRPWLHADLFENVELDVATGFKLSPGQTQVVDAVENKKPIEPSWLLFSAYPTAFVIAADVVLEFKGETSDIQSAMEASTFQANASIGYGPFKLSGGYKNSKSKSKSNMETTSTGIRISLQAPQIIAWVSSTIPQLPRGNINDLLKGPVTDTRAVQSQARPGFSYQNKGAILYTSFTTNGTYNDVNLQRNDHPVGKQSQLLVELPLGANAPSVKSGDIVVIVPLQKNSQSQTTQLTAIPLQVTTAGSGTPYSFLCTDPPTQAATPTLKGYEMLSISGTITDTQGKTQTPYKFFDVQKSSSPKDGTSDFTYIITMTITAPTSIVGSAKQLTCTATDGKKAVLNVTTVDWNFPVKYTCTGPLLA